MLTNSKQIDKLLAGTLSVTAQAVGAVTSVVVTSALTTVASTAGMDGIGGVEAVPVQVSSGTGGPAAEGFVTTGALNRAEVWDGATKKKLADAGGNEVYGRVTQAAGVYTLSFFSLVAGTETAFTTTAGNVDFDAAYRFTFKHFPTDQIVGGGVARNVSNDAAGAGGVIKIELVTPTALNTLPALSQTPKSGGVVKVHVNGQTVDSLAGSGLTYAGTALTWAAATAGYNLTTSDRCVAEYPV